MALCVIYPVPGLLHSKGKEGNLKQCQPGTILPPELGLQDLQEPQRTVITNYSWLASVVAYERISFTRLWREWDSNPQSCRPDGNKSDAMTTRPRRYAFSDLLNHTTKASAQINWQKDSVSLQPLISTAYLASRTFKVVKKF